MVEMWRNPWAELRRRPHLVFGRAALPDDVDAVYWPRGDRAAVILDIELDRVERKAALAHELVHDDRGGGVCLEGMPEMYKTIARREELRVGRIAASHLVPVDELRTFIEKTGGERGVTLWEIAEEFDVPEIVARRAIDQLRE